MPFAATAIPSIQLAVLEGHLRERDVNIKSRHLYLKSAEIYGLKNYNHLIFPPNDSYTAQMAFSRYVFPEHWENTKEVFRKYFDEKISKNVDFAKDFTFENYVKQTDEFFHWTIENIDWEKFDIIGFTLNYGQFLPSLAVAKQIKCLDSKKKIVFGGSRTTGGLGVKVLESFDFVDFIVSGDGEEALFHLAVDNTVESIPGLIYRKKDNVVFNNSDNCVDLNSRSIPYFGSYFEELCSTSDEVQQYFHVYGVLPIEISRGCWWNKCSFCNLNLQHKRYREKNVDKIVEEIQFLSDKYKMLNFQIIGNTLPVKEYKVLFEKIKSLDKDFNFVAEARAGRLKSDDYTLMKESGFTVIQTGIESFSRSYLKKMNKGTHVIDNIAALKFCKENSIKNNYNLIINYPNEEPVDFEETKKNIQFFKQYLDIPQICNLRVMYDSPIQCNPKQYNIKELKPISVDEIMFPAEFLEKDFNFVFDFKKKKQLEENNWDELVENWKKQREQLTLEGVKTQRNVDRFVFYFVDGNSFIKIYDKRSCVNVMVYILDEIEREVFLSCIDVISFEELQNQCLHIAKNQLETVLKSFEQTGIVFREDDRYLSLPLNYKKLIGINKDSQRSLQSKNISKEKILV